MKIKLIKKLAVFGSLLVVALVVSGGHSRASAQTLPTAQTSPTPTTAYTYIARPGDSLTIMVRRSVQLYASAKHVRLSNAAAMFCETNIVQKMGSRRLDIGDKVSVSFDILQKYISNGRKLSKPKLVAWSYWANLASFDLGGLNPTNIKPAQTAAATHASSASTNTPSRQNNSKTKGSTKDTWLGVRKLYWVGIALFAAATGYYFTRFKP